MNNPKTSLVVQWLRLHTPNAGGMNLIPGQKTKIPHAMHCNQKKKKRKKGRKKKTAKKREIRVGVIPATCSS